MCRGTWHRRIRQTALAVATTLRRSRFDARTELPFYLAAIGSRSLGLFVAGLMMLSAPAILVYLARVAAVGFVGFLNH